MADNTPLIPKLPTFDPLKGMHSLSARGVVPGMKAFGAAQRPAAQRKAMFSRMKSPANPLVAMGKRG